MIVDAHVHVGAWKHTDFLSREASLADAVAVFRASGVAGAVVMPTDTYDNAGLLGAARAQLEAGYDGSLWLFPWVRPVDDTPDGGDGARDLAWVREHAAALSGIKIHPSLSRSRVSHPGYAPLIEAAGELGLVVLVHCGRWQEIASYRFAIETAVKYPAVRFLLAHAGGDTPPLATAAADLVASSGVDNVWFDIAGLREYWVIERNVRRIGADRYLMGSDFCLAHPQMYIGAIGGMNLDEPAKDAILGGNAVKLLDSPVSLASLAALTPATPADGSEP